MATPRRSCTRAGRSDCASCARSSTSSRATDTSAPESLGILGGTFNPPHLGHLALARHALSELELDGVLLIPVHTPPHKPGGERVWDPGPEHRLRMCELLLSGQPRLSVCTLEVDRGGLSYTVDTLNAIHVEKPDAALTLIVGADTASTLAGWREPASVLELADLAVATRAGSANREQVLNTVEGIVGADPVPRVSFLNMPEIDVSSSRIRELATRGEAIEALVGPVLAAYIDEHHLYRPPAAANSTPASTHYP